MRELVVNAFITLDGVMQAPGGPEEDPTGGFEFGGWSVPHWDDAMAEASAEQFRTPFDVVLGRKTYEIFAAHWPYAEGEIADTLNAARKYVASNTLTSADWHNSVVLSGDVPAQVRELKEQDGPELRVIGSANLIQTLNANDLVDEYGLWISPVIVGKGKRIFGDDLAPATLELVESKTSTTGVLLNRYRKAGPVETGSFAFEEPTEAERERRARMAEAGS
jgi:dihydrofolate reductase